MNRINKIKDWFLFVLAVLCVGGVQAQEPYYYYKGEKQPLALDKTHLNVKTATGIQKLAASELAAKGLKLANSPITADATFGKVEFKSVPTDAEYHEKVRSLKANKEVLAVYPSYLTPDDASVGSTSYFKVKLKQATDYPLLERFAKEKQVVISGQNKFMPLWYTLKCTADTPDDMLITANSFHESGLFASAEPDLISTILHSSTEYCANDPNFPQQWGLQNTQYPGIDISACQAWELSQGEGVKVAVFDVGVELTHEDLQANIGSSYNAFNGSSPSMVFYEEYHGTHCAGIIGAVKDNNIQVTGVAPKCILMPVSYPFSFSGEVDSICAADGINWAWKNGADVINNSWGTTTRSNMLDEAVDSALVRGRGGKGTVVVFSTGNNGGAVAYPANSNSKILSVGAINKYGNKWESSNYGSSLDLVAPGDSILSTMLRGAPAYKKGTSMAAPFVSGVAALVLSRNHLLTGEEVRAILKKKAKKIGGYTYQTRLGDSNGAWCEWLGYGLVDAYAAVNMACSEIEFINQVITTDRTVRNCVINTVNVSVNSTAKLTFEYSKGVNVVGNFDVKRGAKLEIK